MTTKDDGTLRGFTSGATRDTAEGKLVYTGFYSPFVMRQFARFMNMNRLQSDGKLRDADNWQKGIPASVYIESLGRHFMEFWEETEKRKCFSSDWPRQSDVALIAAACGMMFNIQGYVLEWLKKNPEVRFDEDEPTPEMRERQEKIKGMYKEDDFEDILASTQECEEAVTAPCNGSCTVCEEPLCHEDYKRDEPCECCPGDCDCNEQDASGNYDDLQSAMTAIIESHKEMIEGIKIEINPDKDKPKVHTVDCNDCKWLHVEYDQHPCDCCENDSNFVEKG